jgi:hypothetical protein
MVDMEILNDAELLKNIQFRFEKDLIHTFIGKKILN